MKRIILIACVLLGAATLAGCIGAKPASQKSAEKAFPPGATEIMELGNGYWLYKLAIGKEKCQFLARFHYGYAGTVHSDTALVSCVASR